MSSGHSFYVNGVMSLPPQYRPLTPLSERDQLAAMHHNMRVAGQFARARAAVHQAHNNTYQEMQEVRPQELPCQTPILSLTSFEHPKTRIVKQYQQLINSEAFGKKQQQIAYEANIRCQNLKEEEAARKIQAEDVSKQKEHVSVKVKHKKKCQATLARQQSSLTRFPLDVRTLGEPEQNNTVKISAQSNPNQANPNQANPNQANTNNLSRVLPLPKFDSSSLFALRLLFPNQTIEQGPN